MREYRIASLNAGEDPDRFAEAAAKMDSNDGWDVLTRADEISTRLRVRHLEDQPLASLSGGERKRVALAAGLVRDPGGCRYISDLALEYKFDNPSHPASQPRQTS